MKLAILQKENPILQKEIARMKRQVNRQRREIRQLGKVGIEVQSASDLRERMQDRVRAMRPQRDEELQMAKPKYAGRGKVIVGTRRRA